MQATTKAPSKKIFSIAIAVMGIIVVGFGAVQSDFWQVTAGVWMIISATSI